MELNNVSILNLMPPNIAADKNIRMLAEAFDEALRDIIKKIPEAAIIPNLVMNNIVNELLIDLLAWQFHVDFYDPKFPIEKKRDLVMKSLDWHTRKGTPGVVEELISTVFSKAIVQEWFEYGGLPYMFQIATDEPMPDTETRNNLIRAMNSVKNTRSCFDVFKQLVYLIDRVFFNEAQTMEMTTKTLTDNFTDSGRLRRNGRFRRDGTYVNTEVIEFDLDRSGKYKRDAGLIRGKNQQRVPSSDKISPPFLRNTWERERFYIGFDIGKFTDKNATPLLRNTQIQRDSGIVRDGFNNNSMLEVFNTFIFNMLNAEKINTNEQSNVAVGFEFSDTLPKLRDKTIKRDGKTYRGINGIGDFIHMGLVANNYTETVSTAETMKIWMMKHHFRDAGFTRDDGKLLRDSMTLIPLE